MDQVFLCLYLSSSSSAAAAAAAAAVVAEATAGGWCGPTQGDSVVWFVCIFLGPPTFLQQVSKVRNLKMRAPLSLKTSGSDFSPMQRHMPEERNPQLHRCENLTTGIHFVKMENCLTSIVWSPKRRYCTSKFQSLFFFCVSYAFLRLSPPHARTHTVAECELQVKSIVCTRK